MAECGPDLFNTEACHEITLLRSNKSLFSGVSQVPPNYLHKITILHFSHIEQYKEASRALWKVEAN